MPENAHSLSDMELSDWGNMIVDRLREVEVFSPVECKSRVLRESLDYLVRGHHLLTTSLFMAS